MFFLDWRNKMLESILGKLGLSFLTNTLGNVLGKIDNDIAQTAAKSLKHVESQIANGQITLEQTIEANRHIEQMALNDSKTLAEINASLRAEILSQDIYVRRMRPTFGYLMAMTWAAQMFAVAYIMVFETDKASVVINAIESLSGIWAVGLSVLGIYVYKCSEDKKLKL
jgi:hypothetical protein